MRRLNEQPVQTERSFVLCWLHHAVRGHENPALDVAVTIGNQLNKPVLVYQGLAGRHRFNSDRHHTFIMEGAADLQRELSEREIACSFFLPCSPTELSPLKELMQRAAVVVTEDYPVPPFPKWLKRLADHADCPVLAVDCACIIPMQSLGKAYDRAFMFRSKTWQEYEKRILQGWADVKAEAEPWSGDLGFETIDFEPQSIPDLVASCDIDHSVGPVHQTQGGSRAGYQRWDEFLRHGIGGYANLRNDAAVAPPKGVSRMSAYLHHGHVSPFKIARDAAHREGKGPEKFLDELLIWRELAHNFCYYRSEIESLTCLPNFAQQTLAEHEQDRRPHIYTWEQLARGQTHDELWNAAQHSLMRHGELHNNLRMTWGKALLQWTRTPAEALRILIDLNHRYALDGNDPNSYGGLLWCLGLFDRPFEPPQPVLGTVRSRSTSSHRERLDFDTYRNRIGRPAGETCFRVAIIGAGIAGLTAARTLRDHGHRVTVFDKGRGVGGRTCIRRREAHAFDHGSQYFKVSDERFARLVDSWQQAGIVAPWGARFGLVTEDKLQPDSDAAPRLVGVGGCNVIAKHLSEGLQTQINTRIESATFNDGQWSLVSTEQQSFDDFDMLIVAIPPAQALDLLPNDVPFATELAAEKMSSCWTVMVIFDAEVPLVYDALRVMRDSPLAWIARDGAKPGKQETNAWVLQATAAWSADHFETSADTVREVLMDEFARLAEVKLPTVRLSDTQRWKYALAQPAALPNGCYWDAAQRLCVCGDWCVDGKIQGAFLSGAAAAGHILRIDNRPQAATLF